MVQQHQTAKRDEANDEGLRIETPSPSPGSLALVGACGKRKSTRGATGMSFEDREQRRTPVRAPVAARLPIGLWPPGRFPASKGSKRKGSNFAATVQDTGTHTTPPCLSLLCPSLEWWSHLGGPCQSLKLPCALSTFVHGRLTSLFSPDFCTEPLHFPTLSHISRRSRRRACICVHSV